MNYISIYPLSAIFYFLMLITSVFLAYISVRSKNFTQSFFLAILVLFLSIVAGFRGESVGIDTRSYFYSIDMIGLSDGFVQARASEFGHALFIKLVYIFISSPQAVIFLYALITNFLIIKRLWSLRDKFSFSFSVFLYLCFYYILTYNTMRQWVAIAIVFYGMKYLFKAKYFSFSVLVLIASTIHTTALISLSLIPIFITYFKRYSNKHKLAWWGILFSSPLIFGFFIIILENTSIFSQYDRYFRESFFSFSLLWFVNLALIVFILIFIPYSDINFKRPLQDKLVVNHYDFYILTKWICVVSVLIRTVGRFYPYTSRAALYFAIFEITLFSYGIKSRRFGLILKLALIFLGLFNFYTIMSNSGYGQMPYIPFWQF